MKRPNETACERENVLNNVRHLYILLYDRKTVANVKDFAKKACVCNSAAEGWLRRGYVPLPETRRMIEVAFGQEIGSLTHDRQPPIENWKEEYAKRNGAKPSLRGRRYDVCDEETMMVAEDDGSSTYRTYDSRLIRSAAKRIAELIRQGVISETWELHEFVRRWDTTEQM